MQCVALSLNLSKHFILLLVCKSVLFLSLTEKATDVTFFPSIMQHNSKFKYTLLYLLLQQICVVWVSKLG